MPKLSPSIPGIFIILALTLSACQTSTPIPTATLFPTTTIPTPLPPATPAPQHPEARADAQRLDFASTTMVATPGKLDPGAALQVVFKGEAGRAVNIRAAIESGGPAVVSLWGSDGLTLIPEVAGVTEWDGSIPTTQDYYLNLKNTGLKALGYRLTVKMPPLAIPEAKRIQFQPGTTGGTTRGDLPAKGNQRFVLRASAGQQMTINLSTETEGVDSYLYIWSADGTVFTNTAPSKEWSGLLPATQDYFIELVSASDQPLAYQLTINIPPAPTPQAVPTKEKVEGPKIARDQTIRFENGPLDFSIDGAVLSGERDRYTFNAANGEVLEVSVTSVENNTVFTILAPNGKPVRGTEEGKDIMKWSETLAEDGTYSVLVGPTRGNAAYTLKITIAS